MGTMSTAEMIIYGIIILIVFVVVLVILYLLLGKREKKKVEEEEAGPQYKGALDDNVKIESMKDFMDFDDIKDNMIIRKNRTQYVMVLQCQGVNYDLLSEEEKVSVESGFVQFLNTLRFPIQLYVQTRSLNFKDIIDGYKNRMQNLKDEITKLSLKKEQAERTGNIGLTDKIDFEIRRKENVLEYGNDISEYISRMSVNSNILQQKTYVIVSYYTAELGDTSTYGPDELDSMCFSELYTRSQSLIRTLLSSEVYGRILSSEELAELLYVAYNRSESEALQLSKVLEGEYDSLYSTGKDVLQKKQEQLNEQIEIEAIDLATESILAADRQKQEEEAEKKAKVEERAMELINVYKEQMDPEIYDGAIKQVKKTKTKTPKKKAV